jgi:hypothetical protein
MPEILVVNEEVLRTFYASNKSIADFPVGSTGPNSIWRTIKNDGREVRFCVPASLNYCKTCDLNDFPTLCESPIKS